MERKGIWDEERERGLRSGVRKEVLEAFNKAEKEKKGPLSDMFTGVYEEMTEESRAQVRELKRIMEAYPEEYDLEMYEGGIGGLGGD